MVSHHVFSQAQLKSLFLEPYFPMSPGAAALSLPSGCMHAARSSPPVLLPPPRTCCIPQGVCRAALGLWQQMVQAAFKSCNCTESPIPQIEMLLIYLFRCSSGWLLFVSEGICLQCCSVAVPCNWNGSSDSIHEPCLDCQRTITVLSRRLQLSLTCKRGCPCAPYSHSFCADAQCCPCSAAGNAICRICRMNYFQAALRFQGALCEHGEASNQARNVLIAMDVCAGVGERCAWSRAADACGWVLALLIILCATCNVNGLCWAWPCGADSVAVWTSGPSCIYSSILIFQQIELICKGELL